MSNLQHAWGSTYMKYIEIYYIDIKVSNQTVQHAKKYSTARAHRYKFAHHRSTATAGS